MPEQSMLIAFGGGIKALEDGKIGGYLVRFSGAKDPDLYGDYFTADTDYGIHKEFPLHYAHGYDSVLKERRIGVGTIQKDDIGLWFEAQLEQRDEYERAILDLIEAGKLGYSSGAVSHLVTRKEAPNGAHEIKSWPIGEASLTPRPAEPRISVMPLKEYVKSLDVEIEKQETPEPKAGAQSGGPEPQAAKAQEEAATTTETLKEEPEMAENKNTPDEPKVEAKSAEDVNERMIKAMERLDARLAAQEAKAAEPEVRHVVEQPEQKSGPALISHRGNSEIKAYHAWIKGDAKAIEGSQQFVRVGENTVELRASNNTDMNIGTDADGGYLVPTGHLNTIMEKKKERDLTDLLGLVRVPGVGTTTNVPVDASADGAFVSTAEAGTYDRNSPAIGQQPFTKVKYTRHIPLSEELLEDNTTNLMQFIERDVAKGVAITNNTLIIAEAEASGTEFKVTTAAGIAAGEIEDIVLNNTIQDYLESPNVGFVTQAATYGNIVSLLGNNRLYADQMISSSFSVRRPSLLGYPVFFSSKVDADGTGGNKPVLFGDWSQMGYFDSPMTVVRDPYSSAATGQVNLFYRYRTDYEILQAAAIGYGRVSNT